LIFQLKNSSIMKPKPMFRKWMLLASVSAFIFYSCQREIDRPASEEEVAPGANNNIHGHLQQTKSFSSEVARKWQDMQLRMLRLPTSANPYGMNGNRFFAYCGIGLYESVVPGMPAYKSLYGQLSEMPQMPATDPGLPYYWPACANAALAYLNKNFFTATTDALKISMDSLENALNGAYQSQVDAATYQRSVDFGKSVAQKIFDWSKTDGSLTVYPPYVDTATTGQWSPTAPNPTVVFANNWGKNRLFVRGSLNGTSSAPPPPYSTDPASAYYAMVKEVYDVSQSLTPAQIATALYFRDIPGFQAGTHYVSVFSQVMNTENPQLDYYALAHVKTGIAMADAQIGCFKMKYELKVDRPLKYIRQVLGHTDWQPLLGTPPFPDFPSGHAQTGGAFAAVFTSLLGPNYSFTLHTYDNLGMTPRPYLSFNEMAEDIGRSRVYAGIHYTYSCTEARRQGEKIALNILNTVRFEK
jgi:hypothetical protein